MRLSLLPFQYFFKERKITLYYNFSFDSWFAGMSVVYPSHGKHSACCCLFCFKYAKQPHTCQVQHEQGQVSSFCHATQFTFTVARIHSVSEMYDTVRTCRVSSSYKAKLSCAAKKTDNRA